MSKVTSHPLTHPPTHALSSGDQGMTIGYIKDTVVVCGRESASTYRRERGVGDVREEVRVGVEGGSLPLGFTGVG